MNVLVSGGSGYIGSFVVKLLIEQGHHVSVITRNDNEFTTFYKKAINFYKADITEPLAFIPIGKYDLFIHLAAANDVDSSNPSYALNASALGTRYALEFCRKNGIKKFIYFSTFQVYGRVDGNMDKKSDLLPVNDYGITHQFAEQYVEMFHRTSQINYIILRPTNIFGAPMFSNTDRWSLVPSCFCKEVIEKGEINLMSSGKQSRDFIDVNDLASLTVFYCNQFEKFANTIVNISSGKKFTILEISKMVADIYMENYHQSCKINVHSELPKEENIFYISQDELNKTGFKFKNEAAIKIEIKKIFNLLKK